MESKQPKQPKQPKKPIQAKSSDFMRQSHNSGTQNSSEGFYDRQDEIKELQKNLKIQEIKELIESDFKYENLAKNVWRYKLDEVVMKLLYKTQIQELDTQKFKEYKENAIIVINYWMETQGFDNEDRKDVLNAQYELMDTIKKEIQKEKEQEQLEKLKRKYCSKRNCNTGQKLSSL